MFRENLKLKNPEEYEDDFDDEEFSNSDLFNGFMSGIVSVLTAYGTWYPKPNEVRVIMWFDS